MKWRNKRKQNMKNLVFFCVVRPAFLLVYYSLCYKFKNVQTKQKNKFNQQTYALCLTLNFFLVIVIVSKGDRLW